MSARRDPFPALAARIRDLARGEARSAAPILSRMTVRKVTPLVLEDDVDDVILEEDDDDVELHRAVAALRNATPPGLVVGDVVEVREREDGYEVTAVIE